MAGVSARTSNSILALGLGLIVTVAVAGGHLMSWDRRLELQVLDLRFRLFSTAPPNDDIVHVDIDDRSLGQMGRWPWPRRQQAGIVEMLQQCGARAVVLDIIMPEPQEVRYESAADEIYTPADSELVGSGIPVRVFDDAELAAALEKYPNICLPMHIDFATQVALNTGEARIEAEVAQVLSRKPNASLEAVRKQVMPHLGDETESPELFRAYLRYRALMSLFRFAVRPEAATDYRPADGRLIPPLVLFAGAIQNTGFVTFQPDVDGVVRRIPLLASSEGRLWPQFALAVAAEEFARRSGKGTQITADASSVTVRCGEELARRIPVDEQGFMLINWTTPKPGQERGPIHISAAGIGGILQLNKDQAAIHSLTRLYQLALAKKLGQREILALFAQADELYQQQVAYQVRRQRRLLFRPGQPLPPIPQELIGAQKKVEAQIDTRATELFDDFYLQGASEAQKADVLQLRRKLSELPQKARTKAAQIEQLMTRLRKMVAGKICLIGSTATGAADFVPTPISNRAPGVVVHANILNTILQGSFVHRAGPIPNVVVILLGGVIVSLLTATRPVFWAGPATILIAAGYAAANAAIVFGTFSVWLGVIAPLFAMGGAFVIVTAYRQLTEERAKRRIRNLFAHALSPALVDRLIDDPSVAKLGGERRVLTFLFSDLQGFTPMAESLGEQQTVHLLNHYFDHMTEVIQNRCGGYLNKFLGDGLFVFFGAPVFQEDHAARAIRAALQCQAEVDRLNEEIAGQYVPPVKLTCRVGLATGEVMVGNCGSSQRMDYTAIGDAVNLASRLESANKFFGTRILVSQKTWEGRDEEIVARPLGLVRVVGKTESVAVWNVLAMAEHADAELRKACKGFARAMELFTDRNFAAAAELFEALAAARADDKPAKLYLSLCQQYLTVPPGPDWDGTLELTEK